MLRQEDREYVVEALLGFVATSNTPRADIALRFAGTTLPNRLDGGTAEALVISAIALCIEDGWLTTPPCLVTLIRLVPGGTDAKLDAIVERLLKGPPPVADKLAATVLDNGTPFVNRTGLRNHLGRLATPATNRRPILVVSGQPRTGKSYSGEYIGHFCDNMAATTHYPVELKPETALFWGPEQVAQRLVSLMGRTPKHDLDVATNAALLAEKFAEWVLTEAVKAEGQHWFVLDNFAGDKLRPDTRDFVIALADLVTAGIYPRRCRLILIGFDRALLKVDSARIGVERVEQCTSGDVHACVSDIAGRLAAPLDVQPLETFVLGGLPDGEPRMASMNARLRALLMTVDAVKDIVAGHPQLQPDQIVQAMLDGLPPGDGMMPEIEQRLDALRATPGS